MIDERMASPGVRSIASVAALMAHPTRAVMLDALIGGERLSAGDLARLAEVTPPTASEHLAHLVDGGLLDVESAGRHRYYRLRGISVAHALEAVSAIAPLGSNPTQRRTTLAMLRARSCYDHLAGALGVGLTSALLREGSLLLDAQERAFALSPAGEQRLTALGVDIDAARSRRRKFAPTCLDWTERRFHLAGALGAALFERFIEARWVSRTPKTRSLRITHAGQRVLHQQFDLDLPETF